MRAIHRLVFLIALSLYAMPAFAQESRIKDIITIEGIRENQLVGYGLVVGLNGTGDTLQNSPFTLQSLQAMLERLGVNTRDTVMLTENVAAVMVTATLPAFSRHGTRIDVSVSALGDAEDLRGGTLLVTPMVGADGEVYAVAQGPVAINGFEAQGQAASVTRGVPTSGRIPNGGLVEREVPFEFGDLNTVRLSLNNPDLTTTKRVVDTINGYFDAGFALATDPATIRFTRPVGYPKRMIDMLTEIEQLTIQPDQRARVVIDEASGIIVMGSEVRVSTVAIAQGNLTIRIDETPVASQPAPFAQQGQTAILPRTNIQVDDGADNRLGIVQRSVSLQELVDSLNSLGVGPRDMIAILQAIKAAGAMQADLEIL